ncbi:coiled-coil domain-containing protein 191-like [Palaemon carinicauda]|uniref:coiled-coil domain-containing protein 191-like n=1 Tax=Palaemon carinicauda TaxID=392227 RepID=UPI0035B6332D
MDPWSLVVRESERHTVQVEGVVAYLNKQVIQNDRERTKSTEVTKQTVYVIKERNYETYNYIENKASSSKDVKKDDIEDIDDTLSSILVRAMHRKAKRREIEEIRKMKAYELEKRKIEEEKKQCLEAKRKQCNKLREMKEAHQLRVMKEEQWRAREVRIAKQNRMADEFRKKKLLRLYFQVFKKLIIIKHENRIKAKNHYRLKLVQRVFARLILNKEQEQRWKVERATNFHNICILEKFFSRWKQLVEVRHDQLQTATRHHSNILLRRYLWIWKWWATDSLLHRRTQIQYAREHYRRQLLQKGMTHWKSYMEYKKKKRRENTIGSRLRTRVKDVLPDFSPSSTDDDDDDDDDDNDKKENERWEAIVSVMTL